MATLHENTLKFNQKMTVTNTGGNLSTDAGLILVKEFLHSIGFEQLMEKELHFQDSRLSPTHSNETILEQLIFQLIAGYDTDASANILRQDPFFQQMLEKSTLASQPSLSRFWDRISESPDALVQLQALNQAMLDKVR
ncbi:Transposase DDE domain group 1, partial [Trichococcus flocculiformis]